MLYGKTTLVTLDYVNTFYILFFWGVLYLFLKMEYLPQLPKLQVFPGPNDITLISLCSTYSIYCTAVWVIYSQQMWGT